MSLETDTPHSRDPGLIVLTNLLRFHGIGIDPEQVWHHFGGSPIGISEMLRYAKQTGLKARISKTTFAGLSTMPLPGIAPMRDGGFLLVAKAGDGKVLVQSTLFPRPQLMMQAELEAIWDGRLVLMARRASLVDLARRFDITWFLGAIGKYRNLLGEVLAASFFLQLFALASPLIFQVVIDKVLVHRSMSTLDVLVLGFLAIADFRNNFGCAANLHISLIRPIVSMLNWGPGCFGTFSHYPSLIFRQGASATQWRAFVSWKTFAIFSRAQL